MNTYLYHYFATSENTRAHGVLSASELVCTAKSFDAATAEIASKLGLGQDACVMIQSFTLLNPDVSAGALTQNELQTQLSEARRLLSEVIDGSTRNDVPQSIEKFLKSSD